MEDCGISDEELEFYSEVDDYEDDESMPQQEEDDSLRSEGSSATVITKESLLAAQGEPIQKIMDMLSVRQHHARTLLIHFRWNVEKILDYVEIGIDKLFSEAGVKLMEHHNPCATALPLTCDICIDDKPSNQFTVMDCGHFFCNECWTGYFIVKINEGQSRRIRCMAHKCNSICDDAKVKSLVNAKDSQLADKFHRFLLESYVEDNNMVKWCPSVPHCGNAIRVENELSEVECPCGLQFCFSCSFESHLPCSCSMWDLWIKKCQDESETVNWITVNTKICPKCHKLVEKNGGCNLVMCICGQAFCWLCGGATGVRHTWTSIDNHSCGRYKDLEQKTDRAREVLHRYLHYYNRFKAHTDSYKLEAKLKEDIHEKLKALEEKESNNWDYSGVTEGLNMLFRSRRILANSYAFAYFMFGDDLFSNEMTKEVREIKQNLFEDQQQQLETNIEKLSMCLEEPFHDYDYVEVDKIKAQIRNMTKLVGKLCEKLYECIENDLLGSLKSAHHPIAPYYRQGVEKAMPL